MKNSECQPEKKLDKIYSSVGDVLTSYQEVRKIYTALDIKFPRARNLSDTQNWIGCSVGWTVGTIRKT